MLGITLAGKPSKHAEELTESGTIRTKAGFTMLIPLFASGRWQSWFGACLPILQWPLDHIHCDTFSTTLYKPPRLPLPAISTSGLTDLLLLSVSTLVAVTGGIVGYLLYFKKTYEFKLT